MKHSPDMTSIAESDGKYMNCNLDLRLSQPPPPPPPPRDLQQLTVFYNGGICVRDVTEIQARAIISEATKEVEQGRISRIASGGNSPAMSMTEQCNAAAVSSSSSTITSGLSMKKSLQSFLEKRKYRRTAAAPYNR